MLATAGTNKEVAFPIPMRGNEDLLTDVAAHHATNVSDPHEG